MSQHHRPVGLRTTIARMAIAGAATLATVAATAHVAVADDAAAPEETESTESPSTTESPSADAPTATGDPTVPVPGPSAPLRVAPAPAAASTSPAPGDAVEPDYGFQKFRVGVQLADGAFAPGASTIGSELTVTIFDEDGDVDVDVDEAFICTTDASTVESDSTASYCLSDEFEDALPIQKSKVVVEDIPENQSFTLSPGYSAIIEQTSSTEGLVIDTETATVEHRPVQRLRPAAGRQRRQRHRHRR